MSWMRARLRSRLVLKQEVLPLKRNIPRLALPIFAVIFALISLAPVARAQDSLSEPAGPGKLKFAGQAGSLPDLVRRVKPSVVSVLTYDAKGEPLISGSGFFVRSGQVVTNMHVIRGARRV